MKPQTKMLLVVSVLIITLIGVGAAKFDESQTVPVPNARPLTNRSFERTPARLERGKYLVEAVLACNHCHTPVDWTKHDPPIPAGMELAGIDLGTIDIGHLVMPNLTPDPDTGAGKWTDDMLSRAIREGIGHDGRALYPLMPYRLFRLLSDEDVASVVVYLRSLPPARNPLPKTQLTSSVQRRTQNKPQPITEPVLAPDLSTPVKRGAYLVNIIGCAECHTPEDEKGQTIASMRFGGGLVFEGPWGKVASANLTPDSSGIPYYNQALFIRTLRTGYVGSREINPIMPWWIFRNMTDEDLTSIFAYLQTLPPVNHRVDNSVPPTKCPLDGAMHGGGNGNLKH
jgi:mono/diheme cytochrome c family protein